MRNIRLNIAYDGTKYCGWQIQPRDITIQEVIEKALSKIHKKKVDLIGSGRTDSGVHADKQVANFVTDIDSIPANRFRAAINSLLPLDIRVLSSREVPLEFHSRFNAFRRTYKYYIKLADVGHPRYRDFCYLVRRPLNLNLLNDLARELVGEHDFTTFAAAGDQAPTKIRTIYSATFYPEGEFIVFKICGNAFLQRMVRSLTGTLLDFSFKGKTPEDLRFILLAKDRSLVGPTAPARGLFLNNVEYPED
ncbi:tRNA pseudouridine(38-40) synthase TruA [Thiospirochaeta perfilievii]|uniref:tRNA pseudouridine synthase A n=1 Tax=Thiospirochaeta perfilievii TaxID=252967 RepID=A0A5C1QDD9_9SPIO|nr:tRNA pseudouridine(38-40) synthase TruA [Thiospirochaeta perfilievii]QEN05581.1 tRNA pseudouridine(38-40) synthase TruA [Thiospirochaeta perfilievii]